MAYNTSGVVIRELKDVSSAELTPLFRRKTNAFRTRFGANVAKSLERIYELAVSGALAGYACGPRGEPRGFALVGRLADADVLSSLWTLPGERDAASQLLSHVQSLSAASARRLELQDFAFGEDDVSSLVSSFAVESYPRAYLQATLRDASGFNSRPCELRAWRDGDLQPAAAIAVKAFESTDDPSFDGSYRDLAGCLQRLYLVSRNLSWGPLDRTRSTVAVDETGGVLGYALVTRLDATTAHVAETAVAPRHAGKGIGTALLDRVLTRTAEDDARTITLCVSESNARAWSLYEKAGFVPRRRFGAHVLALGEAGKSVGQ